MSVTETPETILCGLLMGGASYEDAVRWVRESDFVDPKAREVFKTIGELVREGRPSDAVSVAERLPNDWFADVIVMSDHASDLSRGPMQTLHYAQLVQRGARRRHVRNSLTDALTRIDEGEDINQITEEVAQKMDHTFQGRDHLSLSSLLQKSAQSIQEAHRMQLAEGFVGESFTLPELDARLGGLFGTSLIVLAARTSVGKSTLGWQIALEAARRGSPAAIIDTEMGPVRSGIRIMSYYYRLNNTRLRLGIKEDVDSLLQNAEECPIHGYPLHVECHTNDLYSIMGQIGRWKREHGIKFAVVDYLQKIKVPNARDRFEARGIVTKELQELSQRLDIPIILLSQFNRGVEKERRPPQLSDLRESGDIEQDADLVIALHGKLEADQFGMRELEIHVLKAKDARTGQIPMKYEMHGPTYTIREGAPL